MGVPNVRWLGTSRVAWPEGSVVDEGTERRWVLVAGEPPRVSPSLLPPVQAVAQTPQPTQHLNVTVSTSGRIGRAEVW
jgi:hypothetical protein